MSYKSHEMSKYSTHGPKHTTDVTHGRHCEGSDHLLPSWFQKEP